MRRRVPVSKRSTGGRASLTPDTYAAAAGSLREAAPIHACDSNLGTNDKRGEKNHHLVVISTKTAHDTRSVHTKFSNPKKLNKK